MRYHGKITKWLDDKGYGFITSEWSKYKHVDISSSPQALTPTQVFDQAPLQHFECSGKTLCSQMTSCEEATYYLKNCAGSVTDGDDDGLPCENQWCGH